MSNKLPKRDNAVPTELSLPGSEAVFNYLSEHPGFFEQFPELLNNLHIPHTGRGTAVSLVERQVLALRTSNRKLTHQLQELIEVARANDVLADRLHRFTLTLLKCQSLEDLLSEIKFGLAEKFVIDQVVIRFGTGGIPNNSSEISALVDVAGEPDTDALLKKIFPANKETVPVCIGLDEEELFRGLFETTASSIKSSVILPLGGDPVSGLLALGSTDEKRFSTGMSVMYLKRLTDIINSALLFQLGQS